MAGEFLAKAGELLAVAGEEFSPGCPGPLYKPYFGPRKETGMERALSRTLGSGKPSQLARQIIDDVSASDLTCNYCLGSILAVWKSRSLPPSVIAAIAGRDFTKANLDAILELADKVFSSSRP